MTLDEFVTAYKPGMPVRERDESGRWRPFNHDEIIARDKANLDITWLKDESLDDLDSLPSPDVVAREIVEDLTAALAEFEAVASALEAQRADYRRLMGSALPHPRTPLLPPVERSDNFEHRRLELA